MGRPTILPISAGASDGALLRKRLGHPLPGPFAVSEGASHGYRGYLTTDVLNILPDKFERPDDFELADYWERSVTAYQESMPSFEAVVRVGPEGLDRLGQALGGPAARAVTAAAGEPDEAGWLTLRLRLEDLWHAEPQILMLGTEAEVLEPEELRDRIAAASRRMAARYG